MAQIVEEYDTKLDSKHRCIIRGIPSIERYHVSIYDDGTVELKPRVLVSPEELSENSRRMIYSSIKNMKNGSVGGAVNFDQVTPEP